MLVTHVDNINDQEMLDNYREACCAIMRTPELDGFIWCVFEGYTSSMNEFLKRMVLEFETPYPYFTIKKPKVDMPWILGCVNVDCDQYEEVYVRWDEMTESMCMQDEKPEVFYTPCITLGEFCKSDKLHNKLVYMSFLEEYTDAQRRKAWVEAQEGRFMAYEIVKYFVFG
jgi:hypothetical protein